MISGTDHLKDFGDEKNDERVSEGERRKHGSKRHHKSSSKSARGDGGSGNNSPTKRYKSLKNKDVAKNSNMFNVRGSTLYQIPVPDKLETKTYGACAEYLAARVSETLNYAMHASVA